MIRCGHCGADHYTRDEVRNCTGAPPARPAPQRAGPGAQRTNTTGTRCGCNDPACNRPMHLEYDPETGTASVTAAWWDHHIKPRRHDQPTHRQPPQASAELIRRMQQQLPAKKDPRP